MKILLNVSVDLNLLDYLGKNVFYFFLDYVNLVKVVVKKYLEIVLEIIFLLYEYGICLDMLDYMGRIVFY